MIDLPTNLVEFLTWIVYGGGGAIAVSFILEKLPWYTGQNSEAKKNIYFGIVSAFTIVMYIVMNYVSTDVLAQLTPYFSIIAIAFINVYIGTGFHRAGKGTADVVDSKTTDEKSLSVEVSEDASGIKG